MCILSHVARGVTKYYTSVFNTVLLVTNAKRSYLTYDIQTPIPHTNKTGVMTGTNIHIITNPKDRI